MFEKVFFFFFLGGGGVKLTGSYSCFVVFLQFISFFSKIIENVYNRKKEGLMTIEKSKCVKNLSNPPNSN